LPIYVFTHPSIEKEKQMGKFPTKSNDMGNKGRTGDYKSNGIEEAIAT
jgi:hypothetical protein